MLSSRCFPFSSIPFLLSPSKIGKGAISFSFLNLPAPHLPLPHPTPPRTHPHKHPTPCLELMPQRALSSHTLSRWPPLPRWELGWSGQCTKDPKRKYYISGGPNHGTAGLAYVHPLWAACLFIACLSFERMELGCQVLTLPHMASSINRTNQASRGGRTSLIASQI